MNNSKFYEAQKELIDISLLILKQALREYKKDPRFDFLFYDNKDIPSHILQPLQSLKNKIAFKPVYKKIEDELNISHFKAKRLIEAYWFSYILNNLDDVKILINKHPFNYLVKKLDILINKN